MKTTTESDYEKQAREFLEGCGATMEAAFSYYGPYFDDDGSKRRVYRIVFHRGDRKPWAFDFGQSIAKSGGTNNGHRQHAKKPTAYDVLACVTKYDVGTFENFCAEFGYDVDSRKAEKLYFDVQKEASECQRMFGDVMEKLQEIA